MRMMQQQRRIMRIMREHICGHRCHRREELIAFYRGVAARRPRNDLISARVPRCKFAILIKA